MPFCGINMIHQDPQILEYINSLDDREKQILIIAQEHLGSSFNIYKSIGFIKWKQQIQITKQSTTIEVSK
jgi:hypothetical protein